MTHPAANWSYEDADRAYHFHNTTQVKAHRSGESPVPIIVKGEGAWVEDITGHRMLDGFSALYCTNIGYGRREIVDAVAAQGTDLAYFHTFAGHSNKPVIELAERLIAMAPKGMSKVFFGLSGSDANDTQVKIIRYVNNVLGRPEKKKIIARERGYHGSGMVSGSLTGMPLWHRLFDLPIDGVRHLSAPYYYRNAGPGLSEQDYAQACAVELERLILREGPETIAAFVAEPVLGTGGLIPPPDGYWPRIQAVLRKYDVLLVADEVVCGFGRMGTPFGCDYYGIAPDLMSIAKGLTSAYLPMSGVIVSQKVWDILEDGAERYGVFGHCTTYGGHPLSAAAANANLDIIEREGLIDAVARLTPYFQERLRDTLADHPLVGDVRGEGLLAGVELVRSKDTKASFADEVKPHHRASAHARARGLIARAMPHGQILGFAPPFIITRNDVDFIADTTRQALDSTLMDLRTEGLF